jgi:lysophospholipid acyltransferase (LPLAT)-like uncharacterized protein
LFFRRYILATLIWLIYKTLYFTWRVRRHEPDVLKKSLKEKTEPIVFAHYHGDEIAMLQLIGPYRIATMSSKSKDGEIMNGLIRLMGGTTSRGSSSRGAVEALKGLVKIIRNDGYNACLAVDGPRGPIYKVKPGIFEISRLTKAPIYFGGVFCDRAWHFPKAWNKTFLPKPFATVDIIWVGPFGPYGKDDDPRDPKLLEQAELQLQLARSKAKELFDQAT